MTRATPLFCAAIGCVCVVLSSTCGGTAAAGTRVRLAEASVLRTEPSESARSVARVAAGAELWAIEDGGSGWIAVSPPDSMEYWIYSALVRDGAVAAPSVYFRSGPGVEHAPLGSVRRGQRLSIKGEKSGWYRIDPPAQCRLYIRRDKLIDPARESALKRGQSATPAVPAYGWKDTDESIGAPVPIGGRTRALSPDVSSMPIEPTTPVTATKGYAERGGGTAYRSGTAETSRYSSTPATVPPPPLTSGKRVEITGILRPVGALVWRRPSRFRLVSLDRQGRARTLCYVIGDEARMSADIGREVRVSGRVIDRFGVRYDAVVAEQMSTL